MNYDVIVLGGGIIGASCAFELSKSGLRVAIVEKRHPSSGASGASAAMLEFQLDAHRGEPFYSLAHASNNLFPALSDEIKNLTGDEFQYERCGILHVASSEKEAEELKAEVGHLHHLNLKASWLGIESLQEACPYLNTDFFGAIVYEEDGQVNGEMFVASTIKAAQKKGAEIFSDSGDVHLELRNGRVMGVRTKTGVLSASKVVVAAGAWSDHVLSVVNVQLGVKPIRGQLVIYDTPTNFMMQPIYTQRHGYLTPKRNGFTLAGTTVEDVGFDESTTEQARAEIEKMALNLVPGLSRKTVRGISAGLRPGSPDMLPFIGPLSDHPEVLVATGHYRNGFLLAPITAKLITAMVNGKESVLDPKPFFPTRFLSSSNN